MENVFTDYPGVIWKSGWAFRSKFDDLEPFITGTNSGEITRAGATWSLQLMSPKEQSGARFLINGISVRPRRHHKDIVEVLAVHPGIISGRTANPYTPQLIAPENIQTGADEMSDATWIQENENVTLLLCRKDRFALVCGEWSPEVAFEKAVAVIEEKFHLLIAVETWRRELTAKTFSVNLQYNPPVALAAESIFFHLRGATGTFSGLWSAAAGFENETFSLNELYPLVKAWLSTTPERALEIVKTALARQQSSGGFPAWAEPGGKTAAAAAWPLIAQAFELAWKPSSDKALLRQVLPALRKYIQWALQYFDPHRDRLPAWQNEDEVFIPGSYERGKATPELTVMLITEIEAILRLCAENDQSDPVAGTLKQEREHLIRTLNDSFWNPETNSFSNAWRDGHQLSETTFGSFMPLFWSGLDTEKQTAMLNTFEETRALPGQPENTSRRRDRLLDTVHLPAIHQFFALAALQQVEAARAMCMLYLAVARESFQAWFDTEMNATPADRPYTPGPVTAAYILCVQREFYEDLQRAPVINRQAQKIGRRFRIDLTDLRFFIILALLVLGIHLGYRIHRNRRASVQIAEAALSYKHGRYTEAAQLARQQPDHPLSQFISANLLMLSDRPEEAEPLYRRALVKNPNSPAALFGYALALQMNGKFNDAVKRYSNFIDLHAEQHPDAAALADEYLELALDKFNQPPGWRRVFTLPLMGEL